MLSFSGNARIFLYRGIVDMRKGFEGLSSLVSEAFEGELTSGSFFVFLNLYNFHTTVLEKSYLLGYCTDFFLVDPYCMIISFNWVLNSMIRFFGFAYRNYISLQLTLASFISKQYTVDLRHTMIF